MIQAIIIFSFQIRILFQYKKFVKHCRKSKTIKGGFSLRATVHPDLKRTLVARSETGLSISQVTDEVLYAGLVEMHEIDELEELGGWG